MAKSRADSVDVPKLAKAVAASRAGLEFARTRRRLAVDQYVGEGYAENGPDKEVPVNLLAMFVQIVGRALIAKEPKALLTTRFREHRVAVQTMQDWMNQAVCHMDLAGTLRRVVKDALFNIGITKVALATPADSAAVGWTRPTAEPYAARADLDDFAFDPHCRDLREAGWVCERQRLPLEVVRESSAVYGKGRKDLTASEDRAYNSQGDERINRLSQGYHGESEFEEFVDLWQVYLPRQKLTLTLADDEGKPSETRDPLAGVEWVGPDSGPYAYLGFEWPPGNPLPLAPVMNLMPLHLAANRQMRKLLRQADRLKTLLGVAATSTGDGKRIQDANDGDAIQLDRPEGVKELTTGGPNPALFQIFMAVKELFDFFAGNLGLLGGRGPQSKTATQDKILNENAGAGVADLQDTTVRYVSDVMRRLAWFYWNHPTKKMSTGYGPQGDPAAHATRDLYARGVQAPPGALRRAASFYDLDLRVDPFSLQHWTPQQRMAALDQLVMQVLTPLMPVLQQQGVQFDVQAYLRKRADYSDSPDLLDIVTIADPPTPDAAGGGGPPDGPRKPVESTRNYVRENPGSETEKANKQVEKVMANMDSGGET